MEILPQSELKQQTTLVLKLDVDGSLTGFAKIVSYGYEALDNRKKMASFNSEEEYIEDVDNRHPNMSINEFRIENRYDVTKPLSETYSVVFAGFDSLNVERIYFNPFILGRWAENPFKSDERLYPVDFGAPLSYSYTFSFEYPSNYSIETVPDKIALALPDDGGSFIFETQIDANQISMRSMLKTNRYIYNSNEYFALREVFAQIVQLHKTYIVLQKTE